MKIKNLISKRYVKLFALLILSTSVFSIVSFHKAEAATYTWNAFLGGGGTEVGYTIAVDENENVYVGGYTNETWGTPVRAYTLDNDGFVAKIDNTGQLVWNTFLGGGGYDDVSSISVDGSGNVYLGGSSDDTWGSPIRSYTLGDDAYVAKLDSSGALLWNTFLGGSDTEYGYSIYVNESGVYLGGIGYDTWGTPVRAYTSGQDAFAAKLNTSGALLWNTFLGGSGDDRGYSVDVDDNGNVYLGGYTNATWGTPVRAYTSGQDAFAVKLDTSGTLLWNTFLGGSQSEFGYSINVDGDGNVYMGGTGTATWGTPVRAYTSGNDGFAAKLDSSGALLWNTFLGGSGVDFLYSVDIDDSGNVYLGGYSNVTWGTPISSYVFGYDGLSVKLDTSGTLIWNTFLGGSEDDYGLLTVVGGSGNVYLGGDTNSTWGTPTIPYTADSDAFAAKLTSDGALATISTYTITPTSGANGTTTPNEITTVYGGTDQTFTITPDSGYRVVDVLIDDLSVGSTTTYTFTNITADHTISATFELIPAPVVTEERRSSGSSVSSRIKNLINQGKVQEANQLQQQFPNITVPTLSSIPTLPISNNPRDLELNTTGEDVKALQQFLNQQGFLINTSGQPGSMGYETTYFGNLTRQALIKFQQSNNITPALGYFGPKTRAFIKTLSITN